jgi:membrane-bound ClpP family serine protease
MLAILTAHGEVSLVLPISLLLGGLLLIAAEFFLPTIVLGFIGAVVSFTGIYLSAEAGGGVGLLFAAVFVVIFILEFVAFRRLLPQTGVGRSLTNASSNDGSAVPSPAALHKAVEGDGFKQAAFHLDGA